MWLEKLIDIIIENSPIQYIAPDEMGYYSLFGKPLWKAPPGVYLMIPVVEKVEIRTITPQVRAFGPITITQDGKTWTVSGDIEYKIVDIRRNIYDVAIADESMLLYISKIVAQEKLTDTGKLIGAIEDGLKYIAKRRWGMEITGVAIKDLATHRSIRLFMDRDEE